MTKGRRVAAAKFLNCLHVELNPNKLNRPSAFLRSGGLFCYFLYQTTMLMLL